MKNDYINIDIIVYSLGYKKETIAKQASKFGCSRWTILSILKKNGLENVFKRIVHAECRVCGRKFNSDKSWRRFCSKRCKDTAYRRRTKSRPINDVEFYESLSIKCKECGNNFYRKSNKNFCSRSCRTIFHRREILSLVCKSCDNKFEFDRRDCPRSRAPVLCPECEKIGLKSGHQRLKHRAHKKLSEIYKHEFGCFHKDCGVTDHSLLDFGHPDNNGAEHRKHIRVNSNMTIRMARWIIEATDEEIIKWNVRSECVFDNQFHVRKGKYPTLEERKSWCI